QVFIDGLGLARALDDNQVPVLAGSGPVGRGCHPPAEASLPPSLRLGGGLDGRGRAVVAGWGLRDWFAGLPCHSLLIRREPRPGFTLVRVGRAVPTKGTVGRFVKPDGRCRPLSHAGESSGPCGSLE